jgi:Ferritin-like
MRRGATLVFRARGAVVTAQAGATAGPTAAGPTAAEADLTLEVVPELAPRDEAVFLLHTAAEIEHALMVQYLYAAWSLPDGPVGVRRWRREVLRIAREEMAHFVDVQNLLRFVGGPLNFDREDFPFRSGFYPFPFRLERLRRGSLARYVVAEMPVRSSVDPELIADAVRLATGEPDGGPVNRVGALYNRLSELFGDEDRLPDDVFRPDTADLLQARPSRFRADVGRGPLYLRTVRSRAEALGLLADVANQGEGEGSVADSHFLAFVDLFDGWPVDDEPSLDVPTHPTVRSPAGADHEGLISHPHARAWAVVFNHHYRMLLAWIQHGLLTEEGTTADGLALRAFDEMFVLGDVGPLLATLPRTVDGAGRAGAPFELPYTLALPDLARDRWAHHQDLIATARSQIAALGPSSGSAEDDVRLRITASLTVAEVFVAAHLDAARRPA